MLRVSLRVQQVTQTLAQTDHESDSSIVIPMTATAWHTDADDRTGERRGILENDTFTINDREHVLTCTLLRLFYFTTDRQVFDEILLLLLT